MYRRLFAMILAFVMVFSMLPGAALATDETPETEPAATEAQETEPKETEPKETEPKETEPKETEPKETEPKETEPKETEPKETEPKETEPKETEPVVTEPVVTEPEETEPQATQPAATEPAPDQKIKFTNPGKRNTQQTTTITVNVEVVFPEGAWMTTDDVNDLYVSLSGASTDNDGYWEEKFISAENGWSETFTLDAGGTYRISIGSVSNYPQIIEGEATFDVEAGTNVTKSYTVLYQTSESKTTVSLALAQNSELTNINFEDIKVHLTENTYGWKRSHALSSDGTAELMLLAGCYTVTFSGYDVDGLHCIIEGNSELEVPAGKIVRAEYTARYVKPEAKLVITLDFAEDSAFQDADIRDINVVVENQDTYEKTGAVLTTANGRTAEFTLPVGDYMIRFNGYNKKEGYSCSVTGEGYVSLSAADEVTRTHTIRYVKEEGKLTVSLVFAEDSAFGDADIGDITVTVKNDYGDEIYSKALTGANGRTAEFTLPSSRYTISFSGYEKEGLLCGLEEGTSFYCEPGAEIAKTYTVKYVKDEAKLAVSFAFASDSDLQDADIGDITVTVKNGKTNETVSAVLTTANGRTAEWTLPSGSYTVSFSGYEKEDYLCSIDNNAYVSCDPGAEVTKTYTAKYVKDEAKLTVSLAFDSDSILKNANIGDITVTAKNRETDETVSAVLTSTNGRTAELTLPSGKYDISFSGYEKEGYYCYQINGSNIQRFVATIYYVALTVGEETAISRTLLYVKDEATLTISLDFAEESVFGDADIGDITVTAKNTDTNKIYSAALTGENGRTARITLTIGWYTISFSGYEKDGYDCTLEENTYSCYVSWLRAETVNREVRYDSKEATLTVDLTFAEDSDLSGADIGNIVAEIYEVPTSGDDKLIDTLTLSEENGWKAEFTVPAAVKESRNRLEGEFTYKLKLSGTEKEGYRSQFTGADYTITPLPGKKDGWNAVAKYMEAENSVTVKVRLSEDSDMHAYELRGSLDLGLADITGGTVDESGIIHTGSEVFTHTFADLPDSDCYRLNVAVWKEGASIQSFTCTGDVKYEDLEEGQLDFVPDGDCEIEVVLLAKEPKGELTVIARFAEDSILQAEDFPNGLTLTPVLGQFRGSQQLGNALLVSPGNNWTAMTTITTNMLNMVVEQPDGYVGTVEFFDIYGEPFWPALWFSDCPATVYAEICFTEREPAYLDVEFVFDEDSALKGADAGSFFLDVDGIEKCYEFSEESGWHRVLELDGKYNGFSWDYNYVIGVSGTDRSGYDYSAETETDDHIVGMGNDGGHYFAPGRTYHLTKKVCYTPCQTGVLTVNLDTGTFGRPYGTTVIVKDADDNVVAEEKDVAYQCIFELPEAGIYTVSAVKEPDTSAVVHLTDGEKTINFDPAKGATVTLLSEFRRMAPLELRKFFPEGSELDEEDFPDGVTVTLTESAGAFSGTYVLSDANGWHVDLYVPVGYYTAVETNADKEGFDRTTQFTFHHISYASESLRGWSNRSGGDETETVTDTTGGPYHVYNGDGGSLNEIFIYNTYVSATQDRTGSIVINAGDGFWLYGGEQLPGSLGTGYEVEAYQYLVNIDGEEQTVTLKPGETFELDGLAEGAEYTITPIPPEGYAWNTDVTPITGTIGGEDEDDWNVEVSFENDYYYTYEDGILTVVKTDALTDETLKGAKFGLYADKDCTKLIAKATTGKDGTCSFTLTEEGTYYLKELKAPEDYYVKSEKVKTVTVTGEWKLETREGTKVLVQKLTASVAGLPQKDGGYIWENERKTTDISVTKKFLYDEDLERPDSVTIVLYQDDEAYETVKLSEANDWTYVWEDMPLGFEYAVDEVNVAKGYYKQIRSNGYDFTVVNSGAWIPKTGDESQIMFWCVSAMVSLCAIVFLTEKKRRAQNN